MNKKILEYKMLPGYVPVIRNIDRLIYPDYGQSIAKALIRKDIWGELDSGLVEKCKGEVREVVEGLGDVAPNESTLRKLEEIASSYTKQQLKSEYERAKGSQKVLVWFGETILLCCHWNKFLGVITEYFNKVCSTQSLEDPWDNSWGMSQSKLCLKQNKLQS